MCLNTIKNGGMFQSLLLLVSYFYEDLKMEKGCKIKKFQSLLLLVSYFYISTDILTGVSKTGMVSILIITG